MSYNNYPKSNWLNDSDSRTIETNKSELINKIITFSRSTNLWTIMNMVRWKKKGLDDARLETKILKDNILFDKLGDFIKGNTLYDEFGPVKIRLNDNLIRNLNVPSYSQVLMMELGNVKNWKTVKKITPNKFSRDDYVKKIEKLEFEIRVQIIKAYKENDFESSEYITEECIFETDMLDFDEYYNSEKSEKHRMLYEKEWDDYHNR